MSMMKKAVYFGIGALCLTREKAEKFFAEMEEKGEITKDEAQQFVDDVIKKGEEERREFRQMMRQELEDVKKELPFITKSDLEALQARLKAIEDKLQ
ncbi:MAG TPA: hypothetical protein VN426_13820 [Syntrophomonadaceae bacterium]|nr:hypothetical protein [Syntrophomonadaceae bacterium]